MNRKEREIRQKRRTARGRWKGAERSVATELNKVFSDVGKTAVARVPVNGREGPDITINEVGLVINVKSRKVIPERLFPRKKQILHIGNYVCLRLSDLKDIDDHGLGIASTGPWKELDDWWKLMDKWTREFRPGGITTIVLHRPRMPYGNVGIAIHFNDLKRLSCQLKTATTASS